MAKTGSKSLRSCDRGKYRLNVKIPGKRRLPVRRLASKLCAALACRGDCAWTRPQRSFRLISILGSAPPRRRSWSIFGRPSRALGPSATFADDHEMLEHGMILYDALDAWCRLEGMVRRD